MTARAASVLPFSGPTIANTTVTNVPGLTEPIFFSGARLVRAAGLGPLVVGLNLIHVVASYNGTLSISATADRDALPDPATYAECMEKTFQELLASAG
jgi:diacylglycerol O-acyltransferase / wax synthase